MQSLAAEAGTSPEPRVTSEKEVREQRKVADFAVVVNAIVFNLVAVGCVVVAGSGNFLEPFNGEANGFGEMREI